MDDTSASGYDTIYPMLGKGDLLGDAVPDRFARDWAEASADRF